MIKQFFCSKGLFSSNRLKSSSRICQILNNYVKDLIVFPRHYKSQETMFGFSPTEFELQNTQRTLQRSRSIK